MAIQTDHNTLTMDPILELSLWKDVEITLFSCETPSKPIFYLYFKPSSSTHTHIIVRTI